MFNFLKKRPRPDVDPTSLCNLLVTIGWITHAQLSAALQEKKVEEMIGQTLIRMGAISSEQLDEALAQQQLRRHEVHPKDAVLATLDRQTEQQNKIIEGFNELKDKITEATGSKKFEPIKRGAK